MTPERRSKGEGKPNAQYNTANPDSLALRVTAMMRRRMYERFVTVVRLSDSDSVLDVGVTSDTSYASSNYLEAWYPYKQNITAAGVDDARFLETAYPGVRFVFADGRCLPFASNSFDAVHSSAVIEHVGSRRKQSQFIKELFRVARRSVCITTPNRWFPVEVHTSIPLVHWLPPRYYRRVLERLRLDFFADERNLNLLAPTDLRRMCEDCGIRNYRVDHVKLLGWPSNLLLFLRKDGGVLD